MVTAHKNDSQSSSDLAPEVHLPGLSKLREIVSKYGWGWIPSGRTLHKDGVAGLTVAVASVPEGMAGGILAGVNPVYGLYANIIGPVVGGIFSSTQLMIIHNTTAVSLVAGESLSGLSSAERGNAMFLMVMLAGVIAVAFGLLRLGRLTQFVSYSVMTGFTTGIAVVLVLSQLPMVAGYEVKGTNHITKTIDLFRNIGQADFASVMMGLSTLAIAVVLHRTPLRGFAGLVAIAIPSGLVALFNLGDVETVREFGAISRGLPMPSVPTFANATEVVTGALAVALIVLVQGAGVSQSVPNPDGSRRRISRDFIAQGLANVACGLFRGLPVGGSVSTTALNVMAGATRRWAAIFSGIWIALLIIGVPSLVAYVAMPTLGALIILAGLRSIQPADLMTVWQAGWRARAVAVTTFAGILVLPIQLAVGLGVAISALLYISQASSDVSLVELTEQRDGQIQERKPPKHLRDHKVIVLNVYGHLFFAGARTLQRLLPSPRGSERPVVILQLRGRGMLGATLVAVLSRYAAELRKAHGRLYLTGVSEKVHDELDRMRKLRLTGPVRVFEATPIRGESTRTAQADAECWLVGQGEQEVNPDLATDGSQP